MVHRSGLQLPAHLGGSACLGLCGVGLNAEPRLDKPVYLLPILGVLDA